MNVGEKQRGWKAPTSKSCWVPSLGEEWGEEALCLLHAVDGTHRSVREQKKFFIPQIVSYAYLIGLVVNNSDSDNINEI